MATGGRSICPTPSRHISWLVVAVVGFLSNTNKLPEFIQNKIQPQLEVTDGKGGAAMTRAQEEMKGDTPSPAYPLPKLV